VKRALLFLALAAVLRAESVDDILARMDKAAKVFRSLSADVHTTEYTSLFDETRPEQATFKMKKHLKTGAVLLAEFTGKDERKLRVAGNQVEMYHPKANSEDIYDARKFTKYVDRYLLVGFGSTRAELTDAFTVTLGGTETLNGVKTTRLDLTPKKAEDKNYIKMIQIWIPEGQANPIQEKKISPGKENKDYYLLQFSNVKIRTASDPPLPDSDFDLNLPPGVKRNVVK
jgi:hypothetical protein